MIGQAESGSAGALAGGSARPVWLFSLDSERYPDALPLTTAGLKASFESFGTSAAATGIDIVHFGSFLDVGWWTIREWRSRERGRACDAVAAGYRPVIGLSCYTWNTGEFLSLARKLKRDVPELLIVAGGPQVQRAEDYVGAGDIDVVVLGEGELTFTALLDATFDSGKPLEAALADVPGLCFLGADGPVRTLQRPRQVELDALPSGIGAIRLRDDSGKPLYARVTYETVRGCPYSCAFCEWGTGATGTKITRHSMERVRSDLEQLIDGGVQEIFFADANFGQLPEDIEKARILVELKARTGRPASFCTSWGKSHSARVQEVVQLLFKNGLVEHYTLALQTLTQEALENSNRVNMPVNRFNEVVADMTAQGVPITTELIWGLPGDTLESFKAGVDRLAAVFPSVAIYGYTLLPGTEFFAKREHYGIQTVTLHERGNWDLDYVVGSYSFSIEEGNAGYFLVAAHIIFNRGNLLPMTCRYLALREDVPLSDMLMTMLRRLIREFALPFDEAPEQCGLKVYEARDHIYRLCLAHPERVDAAARAAIADAFAAKPPADGDAVQQSERVLAIDAAMRPRAEPQAAQVEQPFDFDATAVIDRLRAMRLPDPLAFSAGDSMLTIRYPDHAGHLLAPGDLPPSVLRAHHAVNP